MRKPVVITLHDIDPNEFETRINDLIRLRYKVLSLDEYLRGECDSKSVLITFDDGKETVYSAALPILIKYKIPAVAFINPARVGENGYCSEQQLKELSEGGVAIANHGWNHIPLATAGEDELKSEYEHARDWIKEKIPTNSYPDIFALPKGSENAKTRTILKTLGCRHIFGSERVDVYTGRSARYFKWSLNPFFQWLRRNS